MECAPVCGLTTGAQVLPAVGGQVVAPWAPLLCCPLGGVPGPHLLGQPFQQQQDQQHQQQLFYNPSIPGYPSYLTFAGHTPVFSVSAGPAAVAAQQIQFDSGPGAVQPAGVEQQPQLHQQELQQPQQQAQKEQPDRASSEEDLALFDLLTDFEQEQGQRQGSLQQQRPRTSDAGGASQGVDDFLDNLYEQQRIAEQLEQQRRQQNRDPADIQPAAVAPEAGMSAPYPYQSVYGNQQRSTAPVPVSDYHPSYPYPHQPYHHGVAVAYNYGSYAPPPHQQLPPWKSSWAAGVHKRYAEAPPGLGPNDSSRLSTGSSNPATRDGTTAGQGQHPGHRSTSHRSNSSKHKGKQQSKQSAGTSGRSAAIAAAIAAKHGGTSVSRNSPEQYFRRHVALVDPFWASATADDVGLLAVTHLPPTSSQVSGAGMVMNSSLDVLLSSSQMTMLRSRTAALQLVCLLVDDKSPHRCHWPCSASLTVNGQIVRQLYAAKRTPMIQLKPHQVDTPADISTLATSRTSIKLSYVSNSSGYVLGARLVRQQSIERVKQMLGRESSLIAAVAEVKKKLAGDGDVEVSVNAVSLRCPLTAMRIKTPAHFTTAPGLAYFDLGPFLELTQRSGKWQDPHSSALGDASQVAVEPWLASIIKQLETADLVDSVDEVEVNPDGSWRPKGSAVDTWFDVLHPPTAPQLREAFRGPAGGGIKRRRSSDDDDDAAEQQQTAKQQRGSADAAGAKGQNGCVDLTLDSDDDDDEEEEDAAPAAKQASAAGLLARRFQESVGAEGLPSGSAGHNSSGPGDDGFAAFVEDLFGEGTGAPGRPAAGSRRPTAAGAERGRSGSGMVTRRQAQKPSNGSQTSNAAAALAKMGSSRMVPPAAPWQQQQQQGREGVRGVPAAADADAEVDVIVIDSDSD